MGQILLVRHGQASFGSADYDALSPLGFEQSRMLGEALGARGIVADAVVHGTMRRHRETAETCAAAAGWSAAATVDPGWDEFDFLSVLAVHPHEYGPEPTKAQFQLIFEEATGAWIAGADREYAETFTGFSARVHEALERVRLFDGTVAVFTSGGPIGWAVSEVLAEGGSADLWTRLNRMAVNSALTRLVSGSRGLNLLTYNDQSHLDGVAGAVTYR
ncbi:histidine phosphatase family protein [Nocardioides marmorisolisilvae]|uniref:Phosphoglycerate mutase n=1 Tax=Nocardioides marmorisolisilvae TaxID=1542737 RepID=A0A3N0DII3_9ACTN|nr:histidine phosphatase family protein [Nocardioides marmorisolisilvae]RNL75479.1 phosphoglycerate mutase [Nocardioides marmorisolisilvae]